MKDFLLKHNFRKNLNPIFKRCTLLILFDGRRGFFYNLLEAVLNFLHLGPGTNNINYKGSLRCTTFGSNSGIKTKWNHMHSASWIGNVHNKIIGQKLWATYVGESNMTQCHLNTAVYTIQYTVVGGPVRIEFWCCCFLGLGHRLVFIKIH